MQAAAAKYGKSTQKEGKENKAPKWKVNIYGSLNFAVPQPEGDKKEEAIAPKSWVHDVQVNSLLISHLWWPTKLPKSTWKRAVLEEWTPNAERSGWGAAVVLVAELKSHQDQLMQQYHAW